MFSSFIENVGEMQIRRLLCNILIIKIILIATTFSLVNIANANDEPDSIADASFDIMFETSTNLTVEVKMNIHRITTDKIYTAQDINNAGAEEIGAIRYAVYLKLNKQLSEMFKNVKLLNFEMPIYENGQFKESFNVEIMPSFFNLSEEMNTANFLTGVLDMSARINYSFNLHAELGWNNTYTIILPDYMDWQHTTGHIDGTRKRITWELKNWNGKNPTVLAETSIKFTHPTTPYLENENISLEFEMDTRQPKKTILTTSIIARAVDISDFDALPRGITHLKALPADGVRLFADNNLISWEKLNQKTIETIENKIIHTIKNSSLNQTLNLNFTWDPESIINCSVPYDVTHMDDDPPIVANAIDDNINLLIFGNSKRAIVGLLNAGATANISNGDINFGDELDKLNYNYSGKLLLPSNIFIDGKNVHIWNNSQPTIIGELKSNITSDYSSQRIESLIEIDISQTDLDFLGFFTGKTELIFTLDIQEKMELFRYDLTTGSNTLTLPDKVILHYINSDGFRLCVEEEIFNEKMLADFLTNKKQLFEGRLGRIFTYLKIDGHINKQDFENSLAWDKDIYKMDDVTPVSMTIYAHSSYPISFNLSILPLKFDIMHQSFNISGLRNQKISYNIIFPKGTRCIVNDSLGKVVQGNIDGRPFIQVTFNETESYLTDFITVDIIPSVLFIIGIFIPCLLSFILLIIFIIFIVIFRKKRRRRKAILQEEAEEGYQEQNYYVPPPPKSK